MLRGSKLSCELVTAGTGREAFKRLMSQDFDLCILEYALPDMTGVQLCNLARRSGCEVPVMFFTAMNRPVDRDWARWAGSNAYLSKPEDLDIFVPTVRRLLRINEMPMLTEVRNMSELARAA